MSSIEALKKAKEDRNKKINKIEKTKMLKSYEEAMADLKAYAKMGYESISSEDKSVFFKYFGIFDKEKSNGANHFMLRVRVLAGILSVEQAKMIGEVAKEYGNDYIDITTRMQIQLRYLKIEDLPTVLEKLESVGISTYQTGMDNLRNIVSDPLDGISYDSPLETNAISQKIQDIFLKNDKWIATLPRKFNTGINGSYANRCNIFGHDCSFTLALKEGMYGYNVYLGGRVGVISKPANVFVKDEAEVLAFFESLIDIFKEYGFRDNRNKNRLKFLIDAVGMETLVSAVKEKANMDFMSAGETLSHMEHFDAKHGRLRLKDGTQALHVVVPAGIFTGSAMIDASELTQTYGKDIRLSIDQNLYVTGVKEEDIDAVLQTPLYRTYKNVDTAFFNHMISCAGSDTCAFGVIPGKADAIAMSEYLSQQIEIENAKIRIYWSACPKGCGVHELGDIGLLGCKAKEDGQNVSGVDILLGGKILSEGVNARMVLKAIPLSVARYYLEELILEYKQLRSVNESFESFNERVLSQYTFGAIAFMMSFNQKMKRENESIRIHFSEKAHTPKVEKYEIFDFGLHLYKELTDEKAYLMVEDFAPSGTQVPVSLTRSHPHINQKLAQMVDMMIKPKERYKVFSEILMELNG